MVENNLKVGAVVLAAGASRRMGRPKMTLEYKGSTVIETVLTTLNLSGIEPLVVVTGGAGEQVENILKSLPFEVRMARNPDFLITEMLDSLKIGMQALPPELDAFLIVLGDQPQIQTGVVAAILNEYAASQAKLIIPSYQMRRGHPWLVDRAFWQDLKTLPAGRTMRDFLNSHTGSIKYLVVETSTILSDLDTPEDYQRAIH